MKVTTLITLVASFAAYAAYAAAIVVADAAPQGTSCVNG